MAAYGVMDKRKNQEKVPSAADKYWRVLIKIDGEFETLLLTDSELKRCRDRSQKNPEDLVTPTFMDTVRSMGAS